MKLTDRFIFWVIEQRCLNLRGYIYVRTKKEGDHVLFKSTIKAIACRNSVISQKEARTAGNLLVFDPSVSRI
jgi:hypothetical protein